MQNAIFNMWNSSINSWKAFSLAWITGLAIILASFTITALLASVNLVSALISYAFTLAFIGLHTIFTCVGAYQVTSNASIVFKALLVFYVIFVLRVLVLIPPPGIVPGA